jgi:hypothetical protein
MTVISSKEPNGVILVEVEGEPASDLGYSSDHRGDRLDKIRCSAENLFSDGIALIETCAQAVVDQVSELGEAARPDELTVQFAIKLDSEVGAVIARASGSAQLQVSLKWARPRS